MTDGHGVNADLSETEQQRDQTPHRQHGHSAQEPRRHGYVNQPLL